MPDKAHAYQHLHGKRTGGTTHYRDPEILRTIPIHADARGGGTIELQALRPYGGGEPIVRLVATFIDSEERHCTTERYLQVPHHGFDALTYDTASEEIERNIRQLIENIAAS